MNDQDLERELRTQPGPREAGYTPGRLPMKLDGAPVASRRPSRLWRSALLVGAGAAGALAVAIASGAFSGSPGVGATGSASPSADATTSPSAVASTPASAGGGCGPQDVRLAAEPWGGAAGSRGTVVTLSLVDGREACMLGKGLAAEIADANGNVLVTTAAAEPGASVSLAPGASFTIGIAWSNWCAAAPAAPVTLSLKMSGWESFVPVPVPNGGSDPVPPCMGNAQPTVLSWTGLEPQP